jgi:TetR/AcrR family fatty acid metabolism transcriptional regulator
VAETEPSFTEGESEHGEAVPKATKRKKRKAPRRKDNPAEGKRERILRAAIKVFARKGFYSTRVSEIAKAASVADGTIYLYFKNKDDVLISIFQDHTTKLIALMSEAIARETGFEAKLRVCVDIQLGLLDGSRELAEVVTVNLRQSAKLLKQYGAPLFGRYLETLASVFEDGQAQGLVRRDLSSRVLSRALWGALDAITLGWALGGGDEQAMRRSAHQVATTFLDGVRRRPDEEESDVGLSARELATAEPKARE